jgi:hypothetical protein
MKWGIVDCQSVEFLVVLVDALEHCWSRKSLAPAKLAELWKLNTIANNDKSSN